MYSNFSDNAPNCSIRFGKKLTNVPETNAVVISGMSGKFPESNNVEEFRDNLFEKVDMTTDDERRWLRGHPEIPQILGKLPRLDEFDAGYFGCHPSKATQMDPSLRILLEVVAEAAFDAGLHPSDLAGTKTGVFLAIGVVETQKLWFYDRLVPRGDAVTGNACGFYPQHVSNFFKLKGPSMMLDSACSSALHTVEHAYKAIKLGQCDAAIVGGLNLCLSPLVSLQFARLGITSTVNTCRVFDNDAFGYVRAETVCALVLQRSKDAKRVYSTVVHAKTNCDGYKDSGITFPSSEMQAQLLNEFYEECSPRKARDLFYLEAHGTGTKVGDLEELNMIDQMFLKDRGTPLSIGSVKSNMGHTEPASGICSISKVIIALETGVLPPNLNYTTPREGASCLLEGRLKVLTEPTPITGSEVLIGINSTGFGGANATVLLKGEALERVPPSDNDVSRLVCVSGRSFRSVDVLLDDVVVNKADPEYVRLLHDIFRKNVDNHCYRGYSIVRGSTEITRSKRMVNIATPKLVICLGTVNNAMIRTFLETTSSVPKVQSKFQSVRGVLEKIESLEGKHLRKSLSSFTMQLVIAYSLRICNVVSDKTLVVSRTQHFLGKIVSAYLNDSLSLEEAVELGVLTIQLKRSTSIDEKLSKSASVKREKSRDAITMKNNNWYFLEIGKGPVVKTSGFEIEKDNKFACDGNFLNAIGWLYQVGFNPQIHNLYPEVAFPVKRGTPMISSKIQWNHDRKYFVPQFTHAVPFRNNFFVVDIEYQEYALYAGHVIDGRNLMPAIGYLDLVWKTLAKMYKSAMMAMTVIFENCRFYKAIDIATEGGVTFHVSIQESSGKFEVYEAGGAVVCSGVVRYTLNTEPVIEDFHVPAGTTCNGNTLNVMTTEDIYKELHLRGYNYKSAFQRIQSWNHSNGQHAKIRWDDNWVIFIENMLQLGILQEDSRSLCVLTGIRKLVIDARRHLEYAASLKQGDQVVMDAVATTHTKTIRSGYIEVSGLTISSINKRKQLAAVLQKHIFIPNEETYLTTEDALRVNLQLLVENEVNYDVKVLELIDEFTPGDAAPLGELFNDIVKDEPNITVNVTVLTNEKQLDNGKLDSGNNCCLIVGFNILSRMTIIEKVLNSSKKDEIYFLSRESVGFRSNAAAPLKTPTNVLTLSITDKEELVLFRIANPMETSTHSPVIYISDDFAWIPKLQAAISDSTQVIVVAQDDPISGILGLVSCLRKEPGCKKVKLFHTQGRVPPFDLNSPFYQRQLAKNLAVNIYQENKWGTYRHLVIDERSSIGQSHLNHSYVEFLRRGDLSSVAWLEGRLSESNDANTVKVYYAAVNLRDVMLASGKINSECFVKDRLKQVLPSQGVEFSGTIGTQRVAGMNMGGSCASIVKIDVGMLWWNLPDKWSFEEGVTVPVAYATAVVALLQRARVKQNQSILIHCGCGGVGLAGIQLALYFGCTVYTTVGSLEKRAFLKQKFPQLKDNHISTSRSADFEPDIMRWTKGKGVDVVLSSLGEERRLASIRCLAYHGKFLELGRFDLSENNELNLLLFERNIAVHGIIMDALSLEEKHELSVRLQDLIDQGAVLPLPRTVFEKEEVEAAYRYTTTEKRIGKVLIKIRNETVEEKLPTPVTFPSNPRYYCDPNKTYIICGGTGGIGLELADWLVLRDCRNLLLVSRSGVTTGYQAYRIATWRAYGCSVEVSKDDITTKDGCIALLESAAKLAPVGAIFNLAAVLRDNIFENQSEESFRISFKPKATATQYLDDLSRTMCPQLRDFVVFSSTSCGRGVAGQTNYGMSNSVMERICDKRKREGFPATAIQWGTFADVGLLVDSDDRSNEIFILGVYQQKLSSCLDSLETILRRNDVSVVSCFVVAEKQSRTRVATSIIDTVANILGLKDTKSISFEATLSEIGMDSLTSAEIKQLIEQEYDLALTQQDIKNMTFLKLTELRNEQKSSIKND